jgi:hypothetical protein
MPTLIIIGYLAFSFSGWLALVKFCTYPHVEKWKSGYRSMPGFDLSWCACTWIAVACLTPIVNISANLYWLWVLRQKIKRRPLIKWPKIRFPKCHLPKCPIAIRAKIP